MSNLKTIQELYDSFTRGDIPSILAKLSDRVEWEYGASSTNVPWLQRRQGPEEVAGFFSSLQEFQLNKFDIKQLFEGDGVVVVLIDVDFTVKSTGRRVIEEDEIHVWRFDEEGKIVRYRHGVDTYKHHLAYNNL
jgi:ketosteroid isomerase-like protein